MNVLFICTGNTCRSPMAEGYLQHKNLYGVNVSSRGLATDGSAATKNAVEVMNNAGIDISNHISTQLTPDDIKLADKIICLSQSHYEYLKSNGISDKKLFILGNGISDPFGGNSDVYYQCRNEIFTSIDQLIENGFFNSFSIIPLEQHHIAPISKLEKVCFSEPWTAEGLLSSYKNGTLFFVAENDRHVMGYIGISAIIDEGYITNVAVYPQYRKKGIATALFKKIIQLANDKSLAFISLEVRKTNLEAINLYTKLGFVTEGLRKKFYRNPPEDALIMTKRFKKTNDNTCC